MPLPRAVLCFGLLPERRCRLRRCSSATRAPPPERRHQSTPSSSATTAEHPGWRPSAASHLFYSVRLPSSAPLHRVTATPRVFLLWAAEPPRPRGVPTPPPSPRAVAAPAAAAARLCPSSWLAPPPLSRAAIAAPASGLCHCSFLGSPPPPRDDATAPASGRRRPYLGPPLPLPRALLICLLLFSSPPRLQLSRPVFCLCGSWTSVLFSHDTRFYSPHFSYAGRSDH